MANVAVLAAFTVAVRLSVVGVGVKVQLEATAQQPIAAPLAKPTKKGKEYESEGDCVVWCSRVLNDCARLSRWLRVLNWRAQDSHGARRELRAMLQGTISPATGDPMAGCWYWPKWVEWGSKGAPNRAHSMLAHL